jgi:hypothetical protein
MFCCIKEFNLLCSKIFNYLNPTAACQTKAKSKKNTGITGATSMIGLKTAYASGNLANSKVPSIFFDLSVRKSFVYQM